MPMNLFDMFTAPNIVAYVEEVAATETDPFLGSTLFPNRRNGGLDISWLRQHTGVAVALRPAAFDTKAELRNRIGVTKIDTELAFFREAMRIGEKDRQQILSVSEAFAQPIIARIYDDVNNLVKGVEVSAERMRMQLLSGGKIDVAREGVAYEYDYQFNSDHKETISAAAKKWSATDTATPLDDIERYRDVISNSTGNTPTRAVCNNATWKYLRNNLALKKAMNPVGYANVRVSADDVKQFIFDQTKITVEVYDKAYAVEVGGSASKYFPDNIFTLLPAGDLGNTYYGTTPEEADLLSGASGSSTTVTASGASVTTIKEPNPVNVTTVVSAVLLPSFEAANSVFIATVA